MLESVTLGAGLSTAEDPWVVHLDAGIQEHWGSARWAVPEIGSLIESWPRLKRVKLSTRLFERIAGYPDSALTFWTCRLKSFELALIKNARVSFRYLDRLLASSTETLTDLRLTEHQMDLPELIQLLEKFGSNLRRLETTTNDFHQQSNLVEIITRTCFRLESLVLGSPVDPREALDSLSGVKSLTAVSLEVGRLDRAVLSSTYTTQISFIVNTTTEALARFSNLKALELTWRTTPWSGEHGQVQEIDLSDAIQARQQGFKAPSVKIKVTYS
ncbi:hypothetical protein OIV83_002070 [Microbotryomycetes sp. JL201]|nr:hypothetical protein OIV83_002070 [Microbotryomycetes sp. JL201]